MKGINVIPETTVAPAMTGTHPGAVARTYNGGSDMSERTISAHDGQPISTEPARPDCSSCGWEIVGEVFVVHHYHANGTVTELPTCRDCWLAEHFGV
jgi:hypothetical protein